MKISLRQFIFILIFASLSFSGYSQSPSFQHRVFTTTDGLCHNQVRRIVQDQFGFLWVATWDGINCFDGLTFKSYYHDPADSTTIPYFEIQNLLVDKDNTIWVQAGSLCRYDRGKDIFLTYSPSSRNYIASTRIYSIATDGTGDLYVFGNMGIECYNSTTGRFELAGSWKDDEMEPGMLAIDDANNFWLYKGTQKKLILLKKPGGASPDADSYHIQKNYKVWFADIPVSNFMFQFNIISTGVGTIWVTSNTGLYYKEEHSDHFLKYQEGRQDISLLPAATDLVWSDNWTGISHYDALRKKIIRVTESQNIFIESFLKDKDGIFWYGGMNLSGYGMGLNEMMPVKTQFHYLLKNRKGADRNLAVFSIFEDSEYNCWIGTKDFPWLVRVMPNGRSRKENILDAKLLKLGGHPRAIIEDHDHNLWIGYMQGLLMKYDRSKQKFLVVWPDLSGKNQPSPLQSFKNLTLLPDSTILAASGGGCCILDPATGHVIRFTRLPENTDIYYNYVDRNNHIWLAGNGKIIHLDPSLNMIESIPVEGGKYNIEFICPDTLNRVWLALLGGGICCIDLVTLKHTVYSTLNGLANNTTYCIFKDDEGNLWVSTNRGISMFNTRTKRFVNYAGNEGLEIGEFNADACFQDKSGKIFFGGMGGMVSFWPDSLTRQQQPKTSFVIITNLDVFQKSKFEYVPVYNLKSADLPKGTKYLRINFANPDFFSTGKTNIRYRVEGLSDEWKILRGNNRIIHLANMKPGTYELQMETTDSKGEWFRCTSLTIRIPPYWYERILFRILIVLLAILIPCVILLYYIKNTRLRQKNREAQLKLISAQSQLNPHFLSNSLNAIGSFLSGQDEQAANTYISEVARLMRDMIDYTGQEFIPMSLEIDLLSRYMNAERMRTDLRFDYEILTGDIDVEQYLIVPSMIQPFVENSIRHGFRSLLDKKGKILIRFEEPAVNSIVCFVQDNGTGCNGNLSQDSSKKKTSRAIEIIRERLTLYNSLNKTHLMLSFSDCFPEQDEKGTLVRIEIPIKKETHEPD